VGIFPGEDGKRQVYLPVGIREVGVPETLEMIISEEVRNAQ
jgi:hypothetical protein